MKIVLKYNVKKYYKYLFDKLYMSKPIQINKKNELTASMIINQTSELSSTPVNKIYKWVDDSLVDACTICNNKFSIINRKHHCRCCGRIFCSTCLNYKIFIPKDYSLLHIKDSNEKDDDDEDEIIKINTINKIIKSTKIIKDDKIKLSQKEKQPDKVCKTCNDNIIRYNDVNRIMKSFKFLKLDIDLLNHMRGVCKIWTEFADFRINKLRELQYSLPNHKFTKLEKKLLLDNYKYIINHPKYLIQLLKSINYSSYKDIKLYLPLIINQLNENKSENKNTSCKKMMCTRNCMKYNDMSCEDALNLLGNNIESIDIRSFAINCFTNISFENLLCYLPYLVFNMQFETIEFPIIGNFLMSKLKTINETEKLIYSNELYWEFKIQLEQISNEKIKKMYEYFMQTLLTNIPTSIKNRLYESDKFVKFMQNLKNEKDEKVINHNLANIKVKDIIIPLHPEFECESIDIKGIHIKPSNSQPIILPLTCYLKNDPDKKLFKYTVMYKFEDIRKDQSIISMIKIIKSILMQEEELSLDFVTYKTRPTGCNHGFIEIVPNSYTIRYIKEVGGYTIQNFIIENNKESSINTIRQKFLKSCAIYCVITYIFGIGDRHLDNIMLTTNGTLFHIDYGFILGNDPKLLTTPTMRIPYDIVEALGGNNSEYFKGFKQLCYTMYGCLRRHINLFINIFTILNKNTKIYNSDELIYDELIKRLMPGENSKITEIQLYNIINDSSKSIQHNVIDIFHHYNKTYLSNIVSSSISYIKSWNPFH